MNHCRITRHIMAITLLLLLSPNGWAKPVDFLGATMQVGPVPLAAQGWSIAVPLGLDARQCQLDTPDDQISLKIFADDEAWLVVEALRPGPISGLLRLTMADGTLHNIAVAAEGIRIESGTSPTLLLVTARGEAPLRRMIRMPAAAESAVFGSTVKALAGPDAEGWQLLEIAPPTRSTEKQGKLLIADGSEVKLQVSLMESVTTLASTLLPAGWRYERIMAREEQLVGRELRARIGVVGLRADSRMLRIYDLKRDSQSREFSFSRRAATLLPALDRARPHRLMPLRAYGDSKGVLARHRFMLRLAGERALLIDPLVGPVREETITGLRFSGAATSSRLRKDRLFAVRRDTRNGVRYLRRWWVSMESDQPRLHGRLFAKPLRERMGVAEIRAFDLRAWHKDAQAAETPARESLLLLAATEPGGQARMSLRVFELQPRRDGSGELAFARRRYTSPLAPPTGGELPSLQWLKTPTVGSAGYPRRLQIGLPNLRAGEIVELARLGDPFAGRAYVQGVRHSIRTSGYSMAPAVFMHAEFDGSSSSVRRRTLGADGLVTRARGRVRDSRIVELRTSARGRHSFALSDDGIAGVESRYAIRLLTNGFSAETNFPPRINAGPDLITTSTGGTGTSVRLRARMNDANGDPLAVRWSAPGVRFADPNARVTRAVFPEGRTQVRVRARERIGKTVFYEASDILDVTVLAPSGTDNTPALVTGLRGVFPNPANPRTNIAFTVGQRGHIRIQVYDLAGRLVRELLNEERNAGAYDLPWDGTDNQGQAVASGVYPVRLISSEGVQTERAVIIR